MARQKPPHKPKSSPTPNMQKGRMVEQIVASMHREPGTAVESNVRLSPAHGQKRKREIDVLITRYVSGYPVHFAIECKNETMPIGAKEVEAFAAKLPLLGIPSQQGIFVSVSGYTIGAREAAEYAGIRLLTLHDALQGLDDAMAQAIRAIVFLLPVLNGLTIEDVAEWNTSHSITGMFFTEQGEVCGTVQDTVWSAWIHEKLPHLLGQYEFNINLPENVYHMVNDHLVHVTAVRVKVKILGIVLQTTGKAEGHQLRNVAQNAVEKVQMNARFEPLTKGTHTTTTVETEEDLQRLVLKPAAAVSIVNRIRLPRINFWNAMYWPPSERVDKVVKERLGAFLAGLAPDPRPFDITELEGSDLSAIFEPFIAPEYPPLAMETEPPEPPQPEANRQD